ncbi:MAG: anhydro-N-acetylmuramic acid kinase [Gaiellales bacterium]|jgi:anhydro-N-acetylmuramic acid kinase|nr:anhydro-N-acetylmuramic acid kinase [Gaiellales bacterium]
MRVIGMISGTSYDAIEALAVDLELDGSTVVVDMLQHVSAAYPPELHAAIAAVLPPATTTIEQVCRLDTAIGTRFAEVAAELAERAGGGPADVVCSHGQTVFHWVEDGRALGTLQLGQPAFIAELTGSTVVSDVRTRDIAAGGQGAPLASLVDVLLLGSHPDRVCGSLNLGGISNVTVVGPDREPIAFDIGPASALLDAVVSAASAGRETYDVDGRGAARGAVDAELLAVLLDEPYYAEAPPKSTGKELFHLAYVRERVGDRQIARDDLLATLTALSAETIANDLRRLGVAEVIAAGGGTRNPTLMRALEQRLPGVSITTMDAYGIAEAAKEALVFALIGFLTVHGLPGSIASCTGASRATVLGSIAPGATALALTPAAISPTRLVVRTPLAAVGSA